MYTPLFDLGQKSQDIIFNRKLRSSKPCQGLMSSCFPWESVAPSAFAIPVGHLCQRAIWGDSGFGVQDMCFWYLFGRPSWWSLGIVLLQPFVSWESGKGEANHEAPQTSNGVKWALAFVFPTGSSSRLIHLSIVRAIWTIEVAKTRSFFDSLKCISLSHWLVMAIKSCMSLLITRSLGHLYVTIGNVTHVRSGPDTYLPSLCSWLRSSRCCFHSMRAMWSGTLPGGRWLKVEGWGWRNKSWWRIGFAKLQNIFFICGKNIIRVVDGCWEVWI